MASKPVDVLIVGTGFSGLCAAIQAKQAGFTIQLLEKGSDVGGVWRENTYPGAACDVPWHLYSFSFFKEVRFSRRYPQQPEILAYQQDCARHYGLYERTAFDTEVASARWDDADKLWQVESTDGRQFQGRALVCGVGQLSRPGWPNIPGLRDFAGSMFHSAEWDHSVDLKGKKVGVIGTGASAIQFIPEIAQEAGQLTVFQRSAPYVLPRVDGPYGWLNRMLFKYIPGYDKPFRYLLWKSGEMSTVAFDEGDNKVSKLYRWVTRRMRESQIPDPVLRQKLTPDYPIGCKRILFTSNYYPTFSRDNVRLVTEGVEAVSKHGLRTRDGEQHEFDVLIMGTGFKATEFLAPMQIRGRGGMDLHQQWQNGAEAYLGLTVPGFPNLFMMYGPNTNLGGNSIIFMIECQARYLVQALQALRETPAMEVKAAVSDKYNADIQERLRHTVWNAGCSSWYHTADGRITNNWPGQTAEYRERTSRFNPADYQPV